MSHDGFNGRCDDLLQQGYAQCAENVAYNWPPQMATTTGDTHVGWMNSADHRANILKAELTEVGYGWYVCAAKPGEGDRIYWTGFFAKS